MNSSESNKRNHPESGKPAELSSEWSDQRIEVILGSLLRTGVLLSASIIVLGSMIYLTHHGKESADYRTFQGQLSTLRSFTGIVHGAAQLTGRALIQLGLLLLIATPIARVLFSVIAFARQRDYLYVAFTLAVLAVLTYSLLEAKLH